MLWFTTPFFPHSHVSSTLGFIGYWLWIHWYWFNFNLGRFILRYLCTWYRSVSCDAVTVSLASHWICLYWIMLHEAPLFISCTLSHLKKINCYIDTDEGETWLGWVNIQCLWVTEQRCKWLGNVCCPCMCVCIYVSVTSLVQLHHYKVHSVRHLTQSFAGTVFDVCYLKGFHCYCIKDDGTQRQSPPVHFLGCDSKDKTSLSTSNNVKWQCSQARWNHDFMSGCRLFPACLQPVCIWIIRSKGGWPQSFLIKFHTCP